VVRTLPTGNSSLQREYPSMTDAQDPLPSAWTRLVSCASRVPSRLSVTSSRSRCLRRNARAPGSRRLRPFVVSSKRHPASQGCRSSASRRSRYDAILSRRAGSSSGSPPANEKRACSSEKRSRRRRKYSIVPAATSNGIAVPGDLLTT